MTWQTYSESVPRFVVPDAWLLLERGTTNLLPNPRTPGSTGWTNTAVTGTVGAIGPDGTASAVTLTETTATNFHGTFHGGMTTVAGTRYAFSVFIAPGTTDIVQLAFSTAGFGSNAYANFVLSGAGSVPFVSTGLVSAGIERHGDFYLCWIIDDAGAAVSTAGPTILFIEDANNTTRNPSFVGTGRTLRLAWPQFEVAPFPTTPVLPAAGAPAASTRGDAVCEVPLASIPVGGGGVCGVAATMVIPRAAVGANQTLWMMHDGTASNAFILRNPAGGSTVQLLAVVGGVAGTPVTLGSFTPGSPFRWAVKLDGDGRALGWLDGNVAQAVTGGPLSGLATMQLARSLSGEFCTCRAGRWVVAPRFLADADLPTFGGSLAIP